MLEDFKVGDMIEMEMIDPIEPRWQFDEDGCFSTGKTVTHKQIAYVANLYSLYNNSTYNGPVAKLEFIPVGGTQLYTWVSPMPGHSRYVPGVLTNLSARDEKDRMIDTTEPTKGKVQGATKLQQLQKSYLGKVNTTGCECGSWACNLPHSPWCKCARKEKEITPIYYSPC